MTAEPVAGRERVDLLLSGGWVITMDPQRRMFRTGAVAIRGSKIIAVGDVSDVAESFVADRTIDASERVVTPGLVNGHRHLLTTAKGALPEGRDTLTNLHEFVYPSFATVGEEDMAVYARHHAAQMLRFGTTLFEEPGCTHIDAALEGLSASGIRCRIGPWTWDQQGPTGARFLPDWLRTDTREAVTRLESAISKVRALGNPRIRDAVTIEGVGTCSDALNVAAAELARDADSLCVLHKATSQLEVDLELKTFGHRPLEHMFEIGALNEHVLLNHMTCLEEFEVGMVADSGARISQNPSSALKLAKGTTQTGKWPELVAAGVPIAVGTDADNASNHHDICRAMYLAALLPRDARRDPNAMSAEQALEMATIGGATALRWDDEVGSIEPGKEADLVAFDTDNFDWRPLLNPVANLVYAATAIPSTPCSSAAMCSSKAAGSRGSTNMRCGRKPSRPAAASLRRSGSSPRRRGQCTEQPGRRDPHDR